MWELQTERLILREMTETDLPALCAIIQDPLTMYAYEGPMSDEETRGWMKRQQDRYHNDGFGLWAVVQKESGNMIGQCGLSWQETDTTDQILEIGYLFNRLFWHQGYAIEAAAACKQYAFGTLQMEEVYSLIRDTNLPSMNVAIRNGMLVRRRFIKHYRGVSMPHLVFSVRNIASHA
ncbi:MAG: GNAT family N-acetyltransferase [Sphaerochaeta sp.]|jgi:RimJ/RimL family protein N-acetyltransferase|nr:GNAT family N-acetyltransferase [Sphaerochaeta sp.]